MATIFINGKFLGAGLNGVHRTAAHYATRLIGHASAAGHEARLVAPRAYDPDAAFPALVPEARPGWFGGGQGWEMLTLPAVARGHMLVNFCNLGPVLHGKSVVMIHDAQTFLYPKDYTGRQAAAYRALLPLIGARARRVLTVSGFSRESLAAHHVADAGKIDVVHNGTDHILDTPADPDALTRRGLKPRSYVLLVGSAKRYKNMLRVFDAMRHSDFADTPLVVAGGPGREAYEAQGWTPPENTIFTGFVSDAELRAFYDGAGVFAFPSRTEGFGLPPVEAMHCGAPVVAARTGAMPEVCGGAAHLVDPEDSEAWRKALRMVLDDDALAQNMSAQGRIHAARFSWDAAGETLWSHLEAVLDG